MGGRSHHMWGNWDTLGNSLEKKGVYRFRKNAVCAGEYERGQVRPVASHPEEAAAQRHDCRHEGPGGECGRGECWGNFLLNNFTCRSFQQIGPLFLCIVVPFVRKKKKYI